MSRDTAILVELRALRKETKRLADKAERHETTIDSFVTMVRDLLNMESLRTSHAKQREQESWLGGQKDDRWTRWKNEPEGPGGIVGRSVPAAQRQGWRDSPAAAQWNGCRHCGDDPCSCPNGKLVKRG